LRRKGRPRRLRTTGFVPAHRKHPAGLLASDFLCYGRDGDGVDSADRATEVCAVQAQQTQAVMRQRLQRLQRLAAMARDGDLLGVVPVRPVAQPPLLSVAPGRRGCGDVMLSLCAYVVAVVQVAWSIFWPLPTSPSSLTC
jgi:hypothetical protein